MIDFPNNPSLGQTFAPPGSPYTYVWDGTAWNIGGGGTSPVPDESPDDGNPYARQTIGGSGGWTRAPATNPESGVGQRVNNIIAVTQVEYNSITRDPNTIYFII